MYSAYKWLLFQCHLWLTRLNTNENVSKRGVGGVPSGTPCMRINLSYAVNRAYHDQTLLIASYIWNSTNSCRIKPHSLRLSADNWGSSWKRVPRTKPGAKYTSSKNARPIVRGGAWLWRQFDGNSMRQGEICKASHKKQACSAKERISGFFLAILWASVPRWRHWMGREHGLEKDAPSSKESLLPNCSRASEIREGRDKGMRLARVSEWCYRKDQRNEWDWFRDFN